MRVFSITVLAVIAPLAAAFAQAPAPLPAGHPPIGDAAAPAAPAAMHRGTVIETADAAPYVYIHVKADGAEEWLAAPAMKLEKGAAITFPDGLVMTNFHSKTLDRNFDKVVFVQQVTPAK